MTSRKIDEKKLCVSVVDVLNSVALKIYKESWTNKNSDPLTAPSRIFFSIWVNDKTLKKNTLYYNIHALKLRQLSAYAIESTKFAKSFRAKFKKFEGDWPNVSTDFGPLTLMEGWHALNGEPIEEIVAILANNFIKIDSLIDETLAEFKRPK